MTLIFLVLQMNFNNRYLSITQEHKIFKIILILIGFVGVKQYGFTQQSAHYMMGEDQFRGVHIYDIIQDKYSFYWISTNEGLFKYDFNSYQKIESPDAKGNAVFNFVQDLDGDIYCNNLNNQIFKIDNDSLLLYYELTENEYSPDIYLITGSKNELLVVGSKIISISKNNKTKNVYDLLQQRVEGYCKLSDGSIHFSLRGGNSILIYENEKFKTQILHFINDENFSLSGLFFFENENQWYALDHKLKKLFRYDPSKTELTYIINSKIFERGNSFRFYKVDNQTWIAGTMPGILPFSENYNDKNGIVLYSDYFISEVYTDHEGNTLLGTFDQGVIVIPDLKKPDVIHKFNQDPIHSILACGSELFLGSSKGKFYTYANSKLTLIDDNGNRSINGIYTNSNQNIFVFDNGQVKVYDKSRNKIQTIHNGSLKDVAFISSSVFFMGTNYGIYKVDIHSNLPIDVVLLDDVNYRIYCLAYSVPEKSLYASTAMGLIRVDSLHKINEIKYKGDEIYAQDIYAYEDEIYLSNYKYGLLSIRNGEILEEIELKIEQRLEYPKKLVIKNDTIYTLSSNGVYIFTKKGKLLKSVNSLFGINAKRIIDFSVINNRIWISHTGGVQELDFDFHDIEKFFPELVLRKILVNDVASDKNRILQLPSESRKVQFDFMVPTLRNRENYFYNYRLQGLEENWNSKSISDHKIIYSGLSPGKYEFQIRLENQGQYGSIVKFPFTIVTPYFLRWWFFLFSAVIFIMIVIMTYRFQMNRIRKKSKQINELNASKLTAIQSQMNPHFIFNSLNSIQDLVLQGDVENSYTYIATFSSLVRKTLNYSEKDFIDFEEEIQLIEIYLSLEKLRFKKDLDYQINTNKIDDILIPPLLIQPFIENALVHGLLHKEGFKKLTISFELNENLICTIEDNGIGREKARAIRARQRSEHVSFSGKAIQNRFDILSNIYERKFGYQYEDLVENGIATGTKVSLTIPIQCKF